MKRYILKACHYSEHIKVGWADKDRDTVWITEKLIDGDEFFGTTVPMPADQVPKLIKILQNLMREKAKVKK